MFWIHRRLQCLDGRCCPGADRSVFHTCDAGWSADHGLGGDGGGVVEVPDAVDIAGRECGCSEGDSGVPACCEHEEREHRRPGDDQPQAADGGGDVLHALPGPAALSAVMTSSWAQADG